MKILVSVLHTLTMDVKKPVKLCKTNSNSNSSSNLHFDESKNEFCIRRGISNTGTTCFCTALPTVQILANFILRTSLLYYELRIEGTVFLLSLGSVFFSPSKKNLLSWKFLFLRPWNLKVHVKKSRNVPVKKRKSPWKFDQKTTRETKNLCTWNISKIVPVKPKKWPWKSLRKF